MINISVPNYYGKCDIIIAFAKMQQESPGIFLPNRRLHSAYGFPPDLIWNGGRVSFSHIMDPLQQYALFEDYCERGIVLKHTCTNRFITASMLQDYLCNSWLKYCEREGHYVTVYSPLLEQHIRANFPKYTITHSATKLLTNIDTINQLSAQDTVVIDYNLNKDEYLAQFIYPENIEILVGEPCVLNCPQREAHYESISKHQLHEPDTDVLSCPFEDQKPRNIYEYLQLPHAISNQTIDEWYNKYHIQNYKISGRKLSEVQHIETLLYYLIRPEYRDEIRQQLLWTP